jgi:hypothetical protein
MGSISAAPSGILSDARSIRITLPLGLTPARHTSLLPPMCTLPLNESRPQLSYSASRSEWVIRPAKWENDQGPTTMRSLSSTDRITWVNLQCRLCLAFTYLITWFFFMIVNTANRDQGSTYISQVIGNHLTSTILSIAKHISILDLHRIWGIYFWTRKGICIKWFHPTPIT